ncbi:MAG: hypothetical protein A2087_05735 [Spirochaetes bacterium GWD1_61_31]|nr:MAG: hypothetical protein A2Y37_13595 [Spirochaetes bacterium GWB1_60_80]OHD43280.1 MAG: hypothetical protein A2087_05735 [Spirochaetes bacterium GWD1_61_31]OHD45630.1 MAG: hypothetical protein A2Y35_09255 [Spirochaetes bacterium GWE1_60_18]HAP44718.1 hypothetical protein [Spirochaetaceae bacterium]HAW85672.1 hypothetical protein [Spirochaetaceae bacterium]
MTIGPPSLFIVFIDSFDLAETWYRQAPGLIAPARQAQLQRLSRAEDRARGLFAEWLCRASLASWSGRRYADITITKDALGKPLLAAAGWPGPKLSFNLSHSHRAVAVLIDSQPVGVDIEFIEPITEAALDGHRLFMNDAEAAVFEGLSAPAERQAYYYGRWTVKESRLKQAGRGLSGDPRALNCGAWHPAGSAGAAGAAGSSAADLVWLGRYAAPQVPAWTDVYRYRDHYLLAASLRRNLPIRIHHLDCAALKAGLPEPLGGQA